MPKPRYQHSVFVVDDEPIIASTRAMVLRKQGIDVRSFIEPLAALQAVLSQPPDLILTDVTMPLFGCVRILCIAASCCSRTCRCS
jgi:two-component system, NtrC family, response regulator AtoC